MTEETQVPAEAGAELPVLSDAVEPATEAEQSPAEQADALPHAFEEPADQAEPAPAVYTLADAQALPQAELPADELPRVYTAPNERAIAAFKDVDGETKFVGVNRSRELFKYGK